LAAAAQQAGPPCADVGNLERPAQRIAQHRESVTPGFTAKYGVKQLVWFEQHATMEHAISREKQASKK